jgi:DNA repair protein RadA/Sms
VVCSLEGTRPLLLEIQALVGRSSFGYPRRVALGFDANRLSLLLAVLEKRGALALSGEDVYVNVAGGLTVSEPVADLGVVAAVASSFRGRAVDPKTVFLGEVGLAGEVRPAGQLPLRIKEISRLGFRRVLVPAGSCPVPDGPPGLEVVGVESVARLLDVLF